MMPELTAVTADFPVSLSVAGWLLRVALLVSMALAAAYLLANARGLPAFAAPIATAIYLMWLSLTPPDEANLIPGVCFVVLLVSLLAHVMSEDRNPFRREEK